MDPAIKLFGTSSSNGHFSPLTLSIMEDAPAEASWRSTIGEIGVGILDDAEIGARRAVAGDLEFNTFLQSITSVHEHNHFATHTSSAFGVLVTYVQLLRHTLIAAMAQMKETAEVRPILDLYDQVLLSLTGYSPDWTQAHAVAALNIFFNQFTGGRPTFSADNPSAPACAAPQFAYVSLLESAALLVEQRYALRYAPMIPREKILRIHERDHLTYFSLLELLQTELGLLAPAELVLKMSLAGPVPFFGSWEGIQDTIGWEAFLPGARLAHILMGGRPMATDVRQDIVAAVGEEHADEMAYDLDIVSHYYEHFGRTGLIRYSNGIHARENSLTVADMRDGVVKSARNLFDSIGFGWVEPILEHACAAFNSFQDIARKSFILAHMSELKAHDGDHAKFNMLKDRENYYALFSVFAGEVRSVYLPSKSKAVMRAIATALENDMLEQLARGRSLEQASAILEQRYGRGGERSQSWITPIIDKIREDFAGAERMFTAA